MINFISKLKIRASQIYIFSSWRSTLKTNTNNQRKRKKQIDAIMNQKEKQLDLINNDKNNLSLKQKEMFHRIIE